MSEGFRVGELVLTSRGMSAMKRKILSITVVILVMIAIVLGVVALRSPASPFFEQSQNAAEAIKENGNDIILPLQEARVTAFTTWRVGNSDNDALSCAHKHRRCLLS